MASRNGSGTALQTAPPRKDFLALLEQSKPSIALLLPDPKQVDRVVRIARTAWQMNADLRVCDGASILGSVMRACELGLEPGGAMKHAYLVPYKTTCTLQISYFGMLELARRSGAFRSIEARLVREGDDFQLYYDPRPVFRHVPTAKPGAETHAYAYAILASGETVLEVMTRAEIEYVRSKVKCGPIWGNWWGEMAKKTAIKRLLKRQPYSAALADAMEHDNDVAGLENHTLQRLLPGESRLDALERSLTAPEPEFSEGTSGEITTEADGVVDSQVDDDDYVQGMNC